MMGGLVEASSVDAGPGKGFGEWSSPVAGDAGSHDPGVVSGISQDGIAGFPVLRGSSHIRFNPAFVKPFTGSSEWHSEEEARMSSKSSSTSGRDCRDC